MVQFLSINFFSWISSIFVGFFKSYRFFVSLCTSSPLTRKTFLISVIGNAEYTLPQNWYGDGSVSVVATVVILKYLD